MPFFMRLVLLCLVAMLGACSLRKPPVVIPSVVDESRITKIDVKCRTFDNSVKNISLKVLDVTANSVKRAFNRLYRSNFPVYVASCYSNRFIRNNPAFPSIHAYGAAIDINYHLNPYFNVLRGSNSIIPKRYIDREWDEERLINALDTSKEVKETEVDATKDAIIQKAGSDDWFINREVTRKGMFTQKEARIFEENGFIIWGGSWRQPMDFMHFQIPRKLAEVLAAKSKKEGEVIWRNHLLLNRWHIKLNKKVKAINKEKGERIWKDHLEKCQLEKDYLMAANDKKTTSICLKDCKRKCRYIDSVFFKRVRRQQKCPHCKRLLN
jgi:hypothetical protein